MIVRVRVTGLLQRLWRKFARTPAPQRVPAHMDGPSGSEPALGNQLGVFAVTHTVLPEQVREPPAPEPNAPAFRDESPEPVALEPLVSPPDRQASLPAQSAEPLIIETEPPHSDELIERPVLLALPPSPIVRRERALIVGVDFGTSSTKVAWQDLSDNHFEIFVWDRAALGVARFLLPSTIVLRGETIHFGVPASDTCEGELRLSSIKLCVLCRRNPSICRCGNPFAKSGYVALPNSGTPYPANAFACLFLAYVFRTVESQLLEEFPDDDLILLWNIGCPIGYLDEAIRKEEWEKMVGVAMSLYRELRPPASTSMVAKVATDLDNFVVPAESERSYFVEPEGLAAVKAFLESPHVESKTYSIVDVGAGTTEVSFFFNGRISAEIGMPLRPSYLADSTVPVGGSKMDQELACSWEVSTEEARKRKESGSCHVNDLPSINEICFLYQNTSARILEEKKLSSRHDKRFDLFVIGGGGRLPAVQSALRFHRLQGEFVLNHFQRLTPPQRLKARAELNADYDLLANACGLASSLTWDYYPPKEVAAMPAIPVGARRRPDVDELYPK